MSKYVFDRLDPLSFEAMVKALVDHTYRAGGALTQFGPGPDGGREATWIQPPGHPQYVRPKNAKRGAPRRWIFQAKYHDYSGGRSRIATAQLVDDLNTELDKLTRRYKKQFDTYVLVTNASLSGIHAVGGRDQLESHLARWRKRIADIQVWDAADLSSMLDGAPEVRITYLQKVVAGDILAELLANVRRDRQHKASIVRAYLVKTMQLAGAAKTDEAGDEHERELRLEHVYIDLAVERQITPGQTGAASELIQDDLPRARRRDASAGLRASTALILSSGQVTLLQAGPGYGKSTICQFLTVLHAARIIDQARAAQLSARMELPSGIRYDKLDAQCKPRIPFRVELRRYAEVRGSKQDGLASYIADQLLNLYADASLGKEDVYALAEKEPCLVILDGLDEVPNATLRKTIVEDAEVFLRRTAATPGADVQMIVSTRPQGYHGEFDTLAFAKFIINDLTAAQFGRYRDDWLAQRIPDAQERREALARVERGMTSPEVARLASTLLQATVILTIAKNKHDIPHERSTLFSRYVSVIFQREANKHALVKKYEAELKRLHEVIGYQLHSAMERGKSGSMPEAEFRNEVLRVWETYRGTEPLSEGVRPVVTQLIEAARDRLVFLRGEGPDQAEIGFLLSSFREFFAAQYLHNHEEADRERVFAALFQREWHWENVLLFYAGMQGTSDQKNWVGYLGELEHESQADRIFDTIRFRRVLLKLLPEFRDFSHKAFLSALDQVLSDETLWAWNGVESVGPIVTSVRRGEGIRLVAALLKRTLGANPATSEAALDLGCKTLSASATEWPSFVDAVSQLAREPTARRRVCAAMAQNDCILSVPSTTYSDWRWGFESRKAVPERLAKVVQAIPAGVAIEAFVRRRWALMSVLENHKTFIGLHRSISSGPVYFAPRQADPELGFVLRSYLTSSRLSGETAWERVLLAATGERVEAVRLYCQSLDEALRKPGDAAAYDAATNMERALELDDSMLSVRERLGPPPSEFDSIAEWKEFAALVDTVRSRGELGVRTGALFDRGVRIERILALAAHPHAWPLWVSEGVLSEEGVRDLEALPFYPVLSFPRRCVDIGLFASVRPGSRRSKLNLRELLSVAVRSVDTFGERVLTRSSLTALLSVADRQPHRDIALAEAALDRLTAGEWPILALFFALACESIDSNRVERFWQEHLAVREPPYSFHLGSEFDRALVQRVCNGNFGPKFVLWVQAWLGISYDGLRASELAAHACDAVLRASSRQRDTYLRALVTFPWSDAEADLWKLLNRDGSYMDMDPGLLGSAIKRICRSEEDGSACASVDAAKSILEQAEAFPSGFGIAAFNRIASIRKSSVGKLEEGDWTKRRPRV